MNYDIRTCDSACQFVLDFMSMTLDEFKREFSNNCKNNFEQFWRKNFDIIKKVDISNIKIMAFHIVGVLDDCEEIKKNGLKNLQQVLSNNTLLKKKITEFGIEFDIPKKILIYNGKFYDINYDNYKDEMFLSNFENNLSKVSRRIYYDFFINGFLCNDNVYGYGNNIHKRPEFLMTLRNVFKELNELDEFWQNNSKSYRIDFYATIKQIKRFTFELDEIRNPPYEDWLYLNDEMKIKKWMLSHAIDRANNILDIKFIYIDDNVIISPNQIIKISKLN